MTARARRERRGEPSRVPSQPSPRFTRTVPALVVVLAAAHIGSLWFVCDDAFISFRYAEHLVHGQGLVYNAGERVEGYSNLLWTLLAAAVIGVGGKPEVLMPFLSSAAALATLILVMAWARRRGCNPIYAGLLVAANTGFAAWGTGGLETALFTLLVTAGVLAHMEASSGERPAASTAASPPGPQPAGRAPASLVLGALLLGLACLTRPEGMLVAACVGAFLLVEAMRRRLAWRAWGLWAGVFAACVAPHLLWRHAYYGHWLPNSFSIKEPGPELIGHGASYLMAAFVHLGLWALALPIFAGLLARRAGGLSARESALVATVTVPFLAFVLFTGGDFMPSYRFVVPIVPLLALAAGANFQSLARTVALRTRPVPASAWAALVLVPYMVVSVSVSIDEQRVWFHGDVSSVGATRRYAAEWRRLGEYLRATRYPTDTLATTAAGIIPYFSRLPTIDMLGLNAREPSQFRRRRDALPGHRRYLSGPSLAALRPQVLLGHPMVRPDMASLSPGLDLEPEWRDRILADYRHVGFVMGGPTPWFVGCMLRKDVAERDSLNGAVITGAWP